MLKEREEVTDREVGNVLSQVIERHHSNLRERPYAAGMTAEFNQAIRRKYMKKVKKIIERTFENVRVSGTIVTLLYDIAAFIHTRQIFSTAVSGLVIAGYGESEIYPRVITFDVGGVVDDRLKYRRNESKSHAIESGKQCAIIPFAQDDMVATFMTGINPRVQELVESYLNQILERLPEVIDGKMGDEVTRQFGKRTANLLNKFLEQFHEHLQNEHVTPVLNMVSVLPKDELAAMAESLVNLTAFKRRITDSMETVGGPIDVAIISKGDGFIWVKRKHYFPADLNQHFFANYFRGISNES